MNSESLLQDLIEFVISPPEVSSTVPSKVSPGIPTKIHLENSSGLPLAIAMTTSSGISARVCLEISSWADLDNHSEFFPDFSLNTYGISIRNPF